MDLPDRKWAERLFDYTAKGLIALHLLLAIFYAGLMSPLLLLVNLACVLSAAVGLGLLRKGRFRAQMLLLFCAELIELTVSAVCAGWSAGLQFPLIGLTALVFLGEYLGRSLKLPYIPALPLGLVGFAVYCLAFLPFYHRPGLLALPQKAVSTVEMLWSVLVFALLIWGMLVVVRLSADSEHSLANKAETDELTGLYNRAGYDRHLAELELDSTILVLVDTDKFKGINDRYGHVTGDRVLKKIARSLLGNFRESDRVCRIGGDEFAVLMLGVGALEDERIREKILYINRELSDTDVDGLPAVSISAGAARGAEAGSWTELFECADAALYQVKKEGGRGCRVHTAP